MAKRRRSGFLAGLIIGIAIGAAVTLVLTPRPVAAPSADPTDAGEGETAPVADDPLAAVVSRVRERYQDALVQGREAFERARAEALQLYNQARSQ
ncbi:MAG TPA: hypothetical protein VF808_11735 [Ktedonobacterales bacterium]